jgi:hypothetical protein
VSDLSKLVGRPVTQLRKEGKLMSLIDVVVILTGKSSKDAADAISDINNTYLEVSEKNRHFSGQLFTSPKIKYFKFPGQGQRETPVAEIDVVIEIIFLLPGAAAAKVRQQAAQLFVRYIGGDESIIEEVLKNKEIQNNPSTSPTTSPQEDLVRTCVSACGAAVKGAYKIDFKIPDEIWDEGDLYFARLQDNEILVKIASSTQISVRSEQHARNGVSVQAYIPNGLKLEIPLQRLMKKLKATEKDGAPPHEREWFIWQDTPEKLLEQVGTDAISAAMTKQSFSVNGNKRQRLNDDRVLEAEVATKIAEEHAKVMEIQAKSAEIQAKSEAVIAEEHWKAMESKVKVELLNTISSGDLVKAEKQIALLKEFRGLLHSS